MNVYMYAYSEKAKGSQRDPTKSKGLLIYSERGILY